MSDPHFEKVRAIDVVPYRWALWCSVGEERQPFANQICHVAWSSDGESVVFGLDSHNAFCAAPEDVLELVPQHGWEPDDVAERHAKFLASRPMKQVPREQPTVADCLRDALTWMGQRTDDTEDRRRIIAAGWAALEGR